MILMGEASLRDAKSRFLSAFLFNLYFKPSLVAQNQLIEQWSSCQHCWQVSVLNIFNRWHHCNAISNMYFLDL